MYGPRSYASTFNSGSTRAAARSCRRRRAPGCRPGSGGSPQPAARQPCCASSKSHPSPERRAGSGSGQNPQREGATRWRQSELRLPSTTLSAIRSQRAIRSHPPIRRGSLPPPFLRCPEIRFPRFRPLDSPPRARSWRPDGSGSGQSLPPPGPARAGWPGPAWSADLHRLLQRCLEGYVTGGMTAAAAGAGGLAPPLRCFPPRTRRPAEAGGSDEQQHHPQRDHDQAAGGGPGPSTV